MSSVTNIILATMIDDGAEVDETHPNVDLLGKYLRDNHGGAKLIKVDHLVQAGKAMECDVFIAAINHFNTDSFIELFRVIEWEFPECAQLFVKGENDDCFSVHTPR